MIEDWRFFHNYRNASGFSYTGSFLTFTFKITYVIIHHLTNILCLPHCISFSTDLLQNDLVYLMQT